MKRKVITPKVIVYLHLFFPLKGCGKFQMYSQKKKKTFTAYPLFFIWKAEVILLEALPLFIFTMYESMLT